MNVDDQKIDGFSDNTSDNAKNLPDAPDKGNESNKKPLSPEEYAKAEKEIKQALDRIEQALHGADWQDANRQRFENSWKSTRDKYNFESSAKNLRSELTTVITKARQMGGQ